MGCCIFGQLYSEHFIFLPFLKHLQVIFLCFLHILLYIVLRFEVRFIVRFDLFEFILYFIILINNMQKTFLLSIYFIIFIKILFIICEVIYLFQTRRKIENQTVNYWKNKFEWLFNILMSLVLIHIFYHRKNNIEKLTGEVKYLIFIVIIVKIIFNLQN